jgi:prepilin-type processing-associated H-X9-DG protein
MEQAALFNALNFSFLAWNHEPQGFPNRTALSTRVSSFLCPSDVDLIVERFDQAHNNYRACAGTRPYNLLDDSPDGTGKNDGSFWWQSAVRSGDIRDGTSQTASFSERCLGNSTRPDPKGDYYLSDASTATCARADPLTTARLTNSVEWSGERWSDGNVFYTRYHHIFTPNKKSCLLGGTEDYDGPMLVTATSRHPGGVNVQMADGSGRFVRDSVDPKVWAAIGSIAGGEVIISDY